MLPLVLERFGLLRPTARSERREIAARMMILFSILGAGLTGLLAQVRIPLWYTPVPITGQVLAVLLCGALLGRGYGALSQVIYVGAGVAGVPWFANATAGFSVMTGVTGGYIVGFIVAAALLGRALQFTAAQSLSSRLALMFVAVAVIHLFGTAYLMCVLRVGLVEGVMLGSAPFVALDGLKAIVAAAVIGVISGRK